MIPATIVVARTSTISTSLLSIPETLFRAKRQTGVVIGLECDICESDLSASSCPVRDSLHAISCMNEQCLSDIFCQICGFDCYAGDL
jgi:hypothetical protein